jgi:hypothetical protein
MDNSFLEEQAARCRKLADIADQFTKRRLLDLAANYEDRLSGKRHPPDELAYSNAEFAFGHLPRGKMMMLL